MLETGYSPAADAGPSLPGDEDTQPGCWQLRQPNRLSTQPSLSPAPSSEGGGARRGSGRAGKVPQAASHVWPRVTGIQSAFCKQRPGWPLSSAAARLSHPHAE